MHANIVPPQMRTKITCQNILVEDFFFSYDEILRDVLDSQIIEGDIKNEETLHHTVISKH